MDHKEAALKILSEVLDYNKERLQRGPLFIEIFKPTCEILIEYGDSVIKDFLDAQNAAKKEDAKPKYTPKKAVTNE